MASTLTRTIQNGFDDFWWKFDAYELRDGYIRSAANAKLVKYYPWLEFREPEAEGKRALLRLPPQRRYHSLLDLVEKLKASFGPNEESILLDWCSKNGLLGLLTCQTEMAVVNCNGHSFRYSRWGGGWLSQQIHQSSPGVLIRELYERAGEFKPVEAAWGKFFPNVPLDKQRDYLYPCPLSEPFWRQYAEPVGDFVRAARLLKSATDGMNRRPSDDHPLRLMQCLTQPVDTIPYRKGRKTTVGWASYSLLSAYAMMATFDLAGMRIARCANPRCRSSFVKNLLTAKYCSKTCRIYVQVNRHRRKNR